MVKVTVQYQVGYNGTWTRIIFLSFRAHIIM